MFNSEENRETCLLSGLIAGCVGGFVATWIMNAAQTAAVQVADQLETQQGRRQKDRKRWPPAKAGVPDRWKTHRKERWQRSGRRRQFPAACSVMN